MGCFIAAIIKTRYLGPSCQLYLVSVKILSILIINHSGWRMPLDKLPFIVIASFGVISYC